METMKVEIFLAGMSNKFPSAKIMMLKERLEKLDDSKLIIVQSLGYKDPTTMLIISLFLGIFGVDRFMLGETGMGILKLLTGGLFGVLAVIDWFLIMNKTKERNLQLLYSVA
ncbi:MAG: hypothetical protein CVU87_08130 [Firmicutes bacterium HGW-Firmicutes-12]|jgi:TM2 domain-containing membrane protein YozV|nr:MAG: hypothetical protein CVU87_08130 [Firmicutes bacterium HGW-Firmicutes-12]